MPLDIERWEKFRAKFNTTFAKDKEVAKHLNAINDAYAEGLRTESTDALDHCIRDSLIQDEQWKKLKPAIFALVDGSDEVNKAYVTVNNDFPIPLKNIRQVTLNNLQNMALCGCEDAGTYAGYVDSRQYYTVLQVLNRLWRYANDPKSVERLTKAKMQSGGTFARGKLRDIIDSSQSVYRSTMAAKTGICTTFGWAAASFFTQEFWMNRGPTKTVDREEVVGWRRGHVYTILNRAGAVLKPGQYLPANKDWGPAIILDVWLGTMGNPYFFTIEQGHAHELNSGFLEGPIESLFDSYNHHWDDKTAPSPKRSGLSAATDVDKATSVSTAA